MGRAGFNPLVLEPDPHNIIYIYIYMYMYVCIYRYMEKWVWGIDWELHCTLVL